MNPAINLEMFPITLAKPLVKEYNEEMHEHADLEGEDLYTLDESEVPQYNQWLITKTIEETFLKGYNPTAMEAVVKTLQQAIKYIDEITDNDEPSKTYKTALVIALLPTSQPPAKNYTIAELTDQPQPILEIYIEYVEEHIRDEEVPLSFDEWASGHVDDKTSIGKDIVVRKIR